MASGAAPTEAVDEQKSATSSQDPKGADEDGGVRKGHGSKRFAVSHKGGGMFPDPAVERKAAKDKVLAAAVHDGYYPTGRFQHIARSRGFEYAGMATIALNAVWIAIDTDYNDNPTLMTSDVFFIVVEEMFCTVFFLELFVRFCAYERKTFACSDLWFIFDFSLVSLMVLESWVAPFLDLAFGLKMGGTGNAGVLKMVKLLRLFRVARMVRLLRACPELMILIKGMVAATRSVFFSLCLLGAFLYVFGIAFTQLCEGTSLQENYFTSVSVSMQSLLLHGTFMDDITSISHALIEVHVIFLLFFFLFVLFSAFTVLNLLIGILCEVVTVIAATEKWELLLMVVRHTLMELLEQLDINEDEISQTDFVNIMKDPRAMETLNEVEVDARGLGDIADIIYDNSNEVTTDLGNLPFSEFMDVVLQFRGNNTCTVRDLVEQRKFMRSYMHNMCHSLERLENSMLAPNQRSPGGVAPAKGSRSAETGKDWHARPTPPERMPCAPGSTSQWAASSPILVCDYIRDVDNIQSSIDSLKQRLSEERTRVSEPDNTSTQHPPASVLVPVGTQKDSDNQNQNQYRGIDVGPDVRETAPPSRVRASPRDIASETSPRDIAAKDVPQASPESAAFGVPAMNDGRKMGIRRL